MGTAAKRLSMRGRCNFRLLFLTMFNRGQQPSILKRLAFLDRASNVNCTYEALNSVAEIVNSPMSFIISRSLPDVFFLSKFVPTKLANPKPTNQWPIVIVHPWHISTLCGSRYDSSFLNYRVLSFVHVHCHSPLYCQPVEDCGRTLVQINILDQRTSFFIDM